MIFSRRSAGPARREPKTILAEGGGLCEERAVFGFGGFCCEGDAEDEVGGEKVVEVLEGRGDERRRE